MLDKAAESIVDRNVLTCRRFPGDDGTLGGAL
jgi:hypothetical protein